MIRTPSQARIPWHEIESHGYVPLNLHRKFQDVAARRVLHPHPRIRIGDFAGVARMFEVIE